MKSALLTALNLILTGDAELISILAVTARTSLSSSLIALLIGVPAGAFLGMRKTGFRSTLIVINRTLMGLPPVVCGLLFYMLFSGVGPFGKLKLLFTVELMIFAQVVLITPIVVNAIESYVSEIADAVLETAKGIGLPGGKTFLLISNECVYQLFSAFLLAFARSIAEVGAVSMVGGAIAWKTNVMTTAIMQYTNRGNFSLGIALGMILLLISLIVNVTITLIQRRVSK